jgi:dTDP-4-dehydrorhamnose 3,5-epimerase
VGLRAAPADISNFLGIRSEDEVSGRPLEHGELSASESGMNCTSHPTIPEILLIDPDVFRDDRGHFLESHHCRRYQGHGLPERFVQDNLSFSTQGVLRGLHYQLGVPQGKLVWVVQGEVFDVAVDIRKGSPTFGRWVGLTLTSDNFRQVYIPDGFAHGFCVTSETALFAYKCTDYYTPREERGIRWNDPLLGIDWPIPRPIVSKKDDGYTGLGDLSVGDLPLWEARRS